MDPRVKTGLENISAQLSIAMNEDAATLTDTATCEISPITMDDEGIATTYDDCSGFCENMD